MNSILEKFLNDKESLKNSLRNVFYMISLIIKKYKEVLDIEILTTNKVRNITTNNLNNNNFYNTYSEEIIHLLTEFIATRIWNYVKFQDILTKLNILIYKYDKNMI
jgi:hypothetical protein